jgi:hypothetical protein
MIKVGPDHFDMSQWFQSPDTNHRSLDFLAFSQYTPDSMYECGTTACLAGYAVLVAKVQPEPKSLETSIQISDWLGMAIGVEPHARHDWFFNGQWPRWAWNIVPRGENKEYRIVTSMLASLVTGKRANWWDPAMDGWLYCDYCWEWFMLADHSEHEHEHEYEQEPEEEQEYDH